MPLPAPFGLALRFPAIPPGRRLLLRAASWSVLAALLLAPFCNGPRSGDGAAEEAAWQARAESLRHLTAARRALRAETRKVDSLVAAQRQRQGRVQIVDSTHVVARGKVAEVPADVVLELEGARAIVAELPLLSIAIERDTTATDAVIHSDSTVIHVEQAKRPGRLRRLWERVDGKVGLVVGLAAGAAIGYAAHLP